MRKIIVVLLLVSALLFGFILGNHYREIERRNTPIDMVPKRPNYTLDVPNGKRTVRIHPHGLSFLNLKKTLLNCWKLCT